MRNVLRMTTTDTPASAPSSAIRDFHHPFTPYDVQLDFMRAVYDVLEAGNGQVGILESPTGTGKSLSLICAALTWLRNHKRSTYEASYSSAAADLKGEPDWVIEQTLRLKRDEIAQRWEDREKQLERIRIKERQEEERARKRIRIEEAHAKRNTKEVDEEAEFLIDDWHENSEKTSLNENGWMASLQASLLREEGEEEPEDEIKIFYTSRTHSQLTQFISELRRPNFPPSVPDSLLSKTVGDGKDQVQTETVKEVPLSSRQRLCVNPSVARLGSVSAINDRCAELQDSRSKSKCSFIPGAENLKSTHEFRDAVLATVPDIEDMYRKGKELQVCPYYASRSAIPGAEVVTLPYPLLLQKSAREALGIELEGNIVIIDEAHNIMDAIASVHAAELRLSELRKAKQILAVYIKRFGKKLKGENRILVAQTGKIVESLKEWLDETLRGNAEQGIVDPKLLLKARGADQINLFSLIKYIQESKLAYKVESYSSHVEEQESAATKKPPPSSTPVLHTLVSFLQALTNLSTEGRIFFEKTKAGGDDPDIKLSYLLLSPTHAFSSIAASARAVILAGGTMAPFEDYKTHLFPTLPSDKITTLSCGHVIPAANLCVATLTSVTPLPAAGGASANLAGPDAFEFSFQKRGDQAMVRHLGVALLNMCTVVPDGVVVFFPSYGYLDEVVRTWQAAEPQANNARDPRSIWARLEARKAVFREARGGSSDEVLHAYSQAILGGGGDANKPAAAATGTGTGTTQKGALLLSVVGGKMSEGINFSDRLGRCVLVVGLPYPNMHSADWKARLEYIESATLNQLISSPVPIPKEQALARAKQAARDFYENACMRAVNQSIGRAIRHRGDYAAIVLVDRRFAGERIRGKLPRWIGAGIVEGSERRGVPGVLGALSAFFRGKREG